MPVFMPGSRRGAAGEHRSVADGGNSTRERRSPGKQPTVTMESSSESVMSTSILIVDDEENLLVLLDRILSKEGYAVSIAHGSHQALDLIEKNNFRAAILDIKMFPLDGVALLSEIKRRAPSTRVIMITAYPTADTRDECFRKGATAYLTKPLDIQKLKGVMRELAD
jgi:DNA-binding NtrC family response regulator